MPAAGWLLRWIGRDPSFRRENGDARRRCENDRCGKQCRRDVRELRADAAMGFLARWRFIAGFRRGDYLRRYVALHRHGMPVGLREETLPAEREKH